MFILASASQVCIVPQYRWLCRSLSGKKAFQFEQEVQVIFTSVTFPGRKNIVPSMFLPKFINVVSSPTFLERDHICSPSLH